MFGNGEDKMKLGKNFKYHQGGYFLNGKVSIDVDTITSLIVSLGSDVPIDELDKLVAKITDEMKSQAFIASEPAVLKWKNQIEYGEKLGEIK